MLGVSFIAFAIAAHLVIGEGESKKAFGGAPPTGLEFVAVVLAIIASNRDIRWMVTRSLS